VANFKEKDEEADDDVDWETDMQELSSRRVRGTFLLVTKSKKKADKVENFCNEEASWLGSKSAITAAARL
jgi:hypothetical protein